MYSAWNTLSGYKYFDISKKKKKKKKIHTLRFLKASKTSSLFLIHERLYTEHFLIYYEIFHCWAYDTKYRHS